jgi:hypothetical protein
LDPHCAERKQPGGSYHFVHISVLKLNIGHEAVPTVKVKEFYWRNLLASNKSSSFFAGKTSLNLAIFTAFLRTGAPGAWRQPKGLFCPGHGDRSTCFSLGCAD